MFEGFALVFERGKDIRSDGEELLRIIVIVQ